MNAAAPATRPAPRIRDDHVKIAFTLAAGIFLVTPSNNLAAVSVLLLDDAGKTSQAAAFSTLIMVVGVLVFFQGVLRLLGIRDVSLIS